MSDFDRQVAAQERGHLNDNYEEPPEEPDQGFCPVHGWHTAWDWEWRCIIFGWWEGPDGGWLGVCQVPVEDDICGEDAEDYA